MFYIPRCLFLTVSYKNQSKKKIDDKNALWKHFKYLTKFLLFEFQPKSG